MIQVFSDGVDVAAGGTYPLNNATFYKGNTAVQSAAGTIALTKRGVYMVYVDGFATLADAGDYSIQLAVNGFPVPQAISTSTVAAGDIGNGSFSAVIPVSGNDCPNNWTSTATLISVINPATGAPVTDGHINVTVTKLV